MIVAARGVYMPSHKPSTHLVDGVMELVDRNLRDGVAITLTSEDVFKMARSGAYMLPTNVDPDNKPQLYGYCCTMLYNLRPNHGSVKRETPSKFISYHFIPDVPKREGSA